MRKVVKQIVLLAVLCLSLVALTLCVSAETYTGECGENLTYTLDTNTGVLTISGSGEMTDWSFSNEVPWHNYSSSIRTVEIANGVTSIGEYAFSDCSSLTSVTIPDSVTSIGEDAFSFCSSLNAVYITDLAAWCRISFGDDYRDPLFYAHNLYLNGELVTDLVVPDGVTSIGDYAFRDCSSLTSITIPDSVTSIGERAFVDCGSLKSITIGNSVTSIGEYTFGGCDAFLSITILNPDCQIYDSQHTIPNTAIIFGVAGSTAEAYATKYNRVFVSDTSDAAKIKTGTCGDNVTYALDLTTGVLTISGTGAITSHPWWRDKNYPIRTVVIEEGVTSIGRGTFQDCYNLTSVTIPSSVTAIEDFAFFYCSLSEVHISDLAAWCNISFGWGSDYPYESNPMQVGGRLYLNGELITNLRIPDGVTTIKKLAFIRISVDTVIVPESVSSIDVSTFTKGTFNKIVFFEPFMPDRYSDR